VPGGSRDLPAHARSWPGLIGALLAGESLSAEETAWAMGEVMAGEASPAQVAGIAVALAAKGESAEEVAGFADAMLARANRLSVDGRAVDVVGTGGDRAHTVNISTMAAIAARAAGATVVKHGNRAASSACGAADLLEALGVAIDLGPDGVARCVAEAGIGFCFAPAFHPAFRHASAPRRDLGVPTVFNFLGPLTNPAQPAAQAVGCADARMAGVLAGVLARRGVSALVFRGDDGLDELTTATTSRVWVVGPSSGVRDERLDPAELGFARSVPGDLRGADPSYNASVARTVFAGGAGPVRDAVLLNAAAALLVLDGAGPAPLAAQLAPYVERVATAIDAGAATGALERWVDVSRRASS
jgi:anthranilate phosphoribosyltransferase